MHKGESKSFGLLAASRSVARHAGGKNRTRAIISIRPSRDDFPNAAGPAETLTSWIFRNALEGASSSCHVRHRGGHGPASRAVSTRY